MPLSLLGAFALAFFILSGAAVVAAITPPWDDESLRLLYLHSLLEDGDINLADDYRDESWRAFRAPTGSFFDEMAGRFRGELERAGGNELFPFYAPGEAVLNLSGYAMANLVAPANPVALRLGARLGVWLASALVVALLYRHAVSSGLTAESSMLLAGVVLFSPMLFFLGVRLWPEMYAGLVLLLVARHQPRLRNPEAALALGMLIGILPLLHLRYAFAALPAFAVLWFQSPSGRSRGLLLLGALLAISPFPLYWSLRNHEATRAIYTAILYPDPTLTGLAPSFSFSYLGMNEFWSRVVAPPAGWILYAPILLLLPLIDTRPRSQIVLMGAIALGMAAQILFYCASSGPLGRYWAPLLPLAALGLLSPHWVRWRFLLVILALHGAVRSLLFSAFPILAFDAKIASQIAEHSPVYLKPLIFLLVG